MAVSTTVSYRCFNYMFKIWWLKAKSFPRILLNYLEFQQGYHWHLCATAAMIAALTWRKHLSLLGNLPLCLVEIVLNIAQCINSEILRPLTWSEARSIYFFRWESSFRCDLTVDGDGSEVAQQLVGVIMDEGHGTFGAKPSVFFFYW